MSFLERLPTVGLSLLAVVAIACDGHSVIGQQNGKGGGGGNPGVAGGGAGATGAGGSVAGVGGGAGVTGVGGDVAGVGGGGGVIGAGGDKAGVGGGGGAIGAGGSAGGVGGGHGGVTGAGGDLPGVGGAIGAGGSVAGSGGASGTAGVTGRGGAIGSGGACPQSAGGASGSGLVFSDLLHYQTPSSPLSLGLGDLDGDGKLDFAAGSFEDNSSGRGGSSGAGQGHLSVFLSSEQYVVVHDYRSGKASLAVAIGDLDGDGAADVATVVQGEVNVLFNAGGGALQAPVGFSVGTNPSGLALGDLNGDGRTDMVVANRGELTGDPLETVIAADVAVLINLGGGNFAAANYPAGSSPVAVAIGDLNGDTRLDLAVASGREVSVLLNAGAGTFGAAASYGAGTNPNKIAIGDLNGDGKPDLVVGNPPIGGASVLLNVGSGTFAAAVNYGYNHDQYNWPFSIAIGDLNGDGKRDLISAWSQCAIAFLPNAGNGTLGAAIPVFAGGSPTSVALGDLNGDGKLDVFVTMQDGVGVLPNAR